jgi:hypothetical protein
VFSAIKHCHFIISRHAPYQGNDVRVYDIISSDTVSEPFANLVVNHINFNACMNGVKATPANLNTMSLNESQQRSLHSFMTTRVKLNPKWSQANALSTDRFAE